MSGTTASFPNMVSMQGLEEMYLNLQIPIRLFESIKIKCLHYVNKK